MKNIISLSVITAVFVLSCTKEIKIDLNSSDPQIVIEGSVPANGEKAKISITKSVNFDESNIFPKVQNAIVILNDNIGNSEILTETSPGIYQSSGITGIIGRTYFLNVTCENKKFSSVSTIPNQVNIDSLIIKKSTTSGGGPGSMIGSGGSGTPYDVIVNYTDPVNETNYYRFLEYINGNYKGNYLFDDRLSNGNVVQTNLKDMKRTLKTGDTIKIELQCIDKAVYDYFNSFGNLDGGPMSSATPANPYTNIQGSVLGYFSAHTVMYKTYVIK